MIVPVVPLHGERVAISERMIVAPGVGIFSPCDDVDEGVTICKGDVVGELVGPGTRLAVRSPFGGTLMGMLAHRGERLREGEPVAWLRVA